MSRKNYNNCKFFLFAYWHDKNWKKFVGATVKIWDLAHNISSFGHKVVLFLPKYKFKKENLPFDIVEIPIIKLPILSFISFNLFLFFVLMFKFARCKPDIMYVRRGISAIPLLYARFKKIFLVFEVNDNPYRKNQSKQTNLIAYLRYKLSIKSDLSYLKLSDLNCVITKKIRNIIIHKNPALPKNKFYILPSGSNTKLFRPLSKKECRLALKLDNSNFYIGFIGTLLYYSGVETLIDAVPYIRKELPNCYFPIIGEGPHKDQLINLTIKRGLQDCITFEGQVEYETLPTY
jgi:glycosyltransferase involved in cell wall biosynthesis